MNIKKALHEFITAHEIDNDSSYTIRNYRMRIGAFIVWLEEAFTICDTDEVKLEHLRGWISYLQKTPSTRGKVLSGVTIHHYGLCMVVFCHWLEREVVDRMKVRPFFGSRMGHFLKARTPLSVIHLIWIDKYNGI